MIRNSNILISRFSYLFLVFSLLGCSDTELTCIQKTVKNLHFARQKQNYNKDKHTAMYQFMAEHLGLDISRILDADGMIEEDTVILENQEQMCFLKENYKTIIDIYHKYER